MAAVWYRQAAEQGHAGAQFQLAVLYCIGRGVAVDLGEAVKWYRRSAEQGDRLAQFNLAVMLAKGDGVEQSDKEALGWCHKAAQQDMPEAQMMLGDLLAAGRGTDADPAAARLWYEKAAAQGLAAASACRAAMSSPSIVMPAWLAPQIDGPALDPDVVGRDVGRIRTVDELSGADIELGEMQRAFDDAAVEPAARQRRVAMAADVAQRVEAALDIGEHDALALDRDEFHLAGREVTHLGDGDKTFFHFAHPPRCTAAPPRLRETASEATLSPHAGRGPGP